MFKSCGDLFKQTQAGSPVEVYPYEQKTLPAAHALIALVVLFLAPVARLTTPLLAAQDTLLPLKVKVGDKASDFALPSADGKTVRLSDYAG
jgi:hypothetical protein